MKPDKRGPAAMQQVADWLEKSGAMLNARRSPRLAGELFRGMVPEALFSGVLNAVAHSIRLAHHSAPSKWGLRLDSDSIMLKVGFVEVLQVGKAIDSIEGLGASWFHELVHRDLVPQKVRRDRHLLFSQTPYFNARNCETCDMDLSRAARTYEALIPAHEAAIRIASCGHRRTDTAQDHSPGLVTYILREIGSLVMQPSYATGHPTEPLRLPEELGAEFEEGAAVSVRVNRYERDAKAREYCVKHHGTACSVCGLSLADQYGPQVIGLIHVHHLTPLGARRKSARVDPIRDLRPVCPNCHAVIHSTSPPRTLEQVSQMMRACRLHRQAKSANRVQRERNGRPR
jgi:5-methylcytosine-specific restriction enzyme A